MKTEHVLYTISLSLLAVAIFMKLSSDGKISDIKLKVKKAVAERKYPHETVKIEYNFPIALSGKSKEEIYQIRKEYVKKSVFSDENYEPSEEVFGGVEGGKPWISLDICNGDGHSKVTGPSEEARFIVNPAVLVALEFPFLFDYDNEQWCNDTTNAMIPADVSFNGGRNEITVTYSKFPFYTQNPNFYQFNGLNARDLGYNYAYVDFLKSTFVPKFKNRYNIARNVVKFQNYIHTGSSCKVEGGCNNGSPRQNFLEFEYPEKKYSSDGKIYIKLWKSKPFSHWLKADMTEIIIIKSY